MKQIKQTLVVVLFILLMSGVASASVETNLPYGETRNLPPDESYIFYDFESQGCDLCVLNIYEGPIQFIDYYRPGYTWKGEPTILHNFWGTAYWNGRAMHVYPWTGWDYLNDEPANWVYLIEGNYAGCPIVIAEGAIPTPFPGTDGVIQFPDGATHVSFLVSTGGTLTITIYDKHSNYINREIVYSTITRVDGPDSPSTWSKVTLEASNIFSIHIRGGSNMFLIDDLVIGGLNTLDPTPDLVSERRDYSWAAENMEKLVGTPYLEWGMGYNFYIGEFFTAEEIKTTDLPYVNFDYKQPEIECDTGIDNAEAIVWAFNQEEDIVNWRDATDQMKHDFTEQVDYEDIQPGDVGFIDYDELDTEGNIVAGDGVMDEIFIITDPIIDDETGLTQDCIRVTPGGGVHRSSTETINTLYNTGTSFVDYRSLKDTPKGGHSPYPKVHGKPI